ncbi:Phytosulfokine receptor 1, partial [Mucuna pruriens]
MGFHSFFLFSILIPYISFGTSTHESENFTISPNDLKSLTGFSNCLESTIPDWNSSTSPDYCTWSGVTCVGTRVVSLELGSKTLTGKICESLAGLDQLRVLNLSHNFFTGSLPHNLFHLQNLQVMDMSNNHFEGSINMAVCSSFTQLRVFKLSNNFFSGEIPGNLGNCSSLQHLSINGNDLSGSLPESIFQLQNLNELYVQDNNLSGPLSEGLGKLSNLVEFDISNNEFSGILPNIFESLTRLKFFSAELNRFTGQLPASMVNSPSLEMLILANNFLGGSLYLNCSAMKNLTFINLGSNQFRCPTPGGLSYCSRLQGIFLGRINFNCEISVNFKNLQSLTQIALSDTNLHNLSATLEVLSHCRKLSTVLLTNNFHHEEMPQLQPQGQNLEFRNLKVFVLANGQMKGSFPKWLSGCKKLEMLDLSWNHLTGSIPSWIGQFNNLYYLDLSNNSFTGKIPQSLTMFLSLQLKNSSMEGTLFAFPVYTLETGTLKRMKYEKVSNLRPSLLLSYNKLEGPIWAGFGNLKGLHVMDLKHNSLSGPIPWPLSGMTMLEILDLSHNKLSGEIPQSLVELSFLSSFDVSYNELHGEVPTKGQFDTFPPTSFEGNMGLYRPSTSGFMLSPPDETRPPPHHQDLEIIGLQFWFGAVAAFLITITMCLASGWS